MTYHGNLSGVTAELFLGDLYVYLTPSTYLTERTDGLDIGITHIPVTGGGTGEA